MSKQKKGPEFIRFLNPVIQVLKESGGALSTGEAIDNVIELTQIPEEELQQTLKNGDSRIRNQVQWARMYLVHAGMVKNETRGLWELTEEGFKADLSDQAVAYDLFQKVQSRFHRKEKAPAEPNSESPEADKEDEEESAPVEEQHKATLLALIQNEVSPKGFEELCKRVLSKAGLEEITITGKAGDRGIDGVGYLSINSIVTEKVLFQCKRYGNSNPVTPEKVREFRGALQNNADKGIIITTSRFTTEAKREALKYPPIETIEGHELIELFEKYQIGLLPKTFYQINYEFFDQFK